VPVDFLNDDQVVAYGGYVGEVEEADLQRYFFLDDEDRRHVERRRRSANRLGFAVQLCSVRALGRFLVDARDVPPTAAAYIAAQLGFSDASSLDRYADRAQTHRAHTSEIQRLYGYREFPEAREELESWLEVCAWNRGEGPKALFDSAWQWLRGKRVLLPGITTLTRLVASAREKTTESLWATLAALLDSAQAARLDEILEVAADVRVSTLERLRKGPRRVSSQQLRFALERVSEIQELGFVRFDTSAVPPRRILELARYGLSGKATLLRRHPRSRRLATLLATVSSLHVRATDDALDLFDVLMVTKLLSKATQTSNKERLRRFPRLATASSQLACAVEVLLRCVESEPSAPLEQVWRKIEAAVDRDDLESAVSRVSELTPSPDSDLDEFWRTELVKKFGSIRRFLVLLIETVEFRATAEGTPILAALRALPGLFGRKKVLPDEIDAVLLRGSWRRIVLLEDGTVDWKGYTLCVLEQFHRGLLHRDIHAVYSRKWSDPREKLLAGETWRVAKPQLLASLELPEDSAEHLADLSRTLDETYREVVDRLPDQVAVSFGEDGRLHLSSLKAEPDPPSLEELRMVTGRMLPRVDLPEVLLEVADWTGYMSAFESLSGGGSRLRDLEVSVAALLVAQGCNTGLTPVVNSSVPALTRDRLLHVDQNYLRTETIEAANRVLIKAQAEVPLVQRWGGGFVASIDGMRFVVPIATVHARPNPRYFGRGTGATWLNMLNDQASGLASRVVAGTPRDSLHVIDVLYAQDGGVPPEVLVTDTASYSDTVFGILTLGGRIYAPQLADIPDQRLWRIDRKAAYGPFNTAARGQIDLEKIRRHWPDMLRIIGSIYAGAVRAHDVIRMLHRDGNRTALGDAIAHYGRIQKTLHILRLADDEAYRRLIKAQTNLHEGRHSFARKIFHGHRGELRQRYREGQEDQIGALGLVLNVAILFNTRYLQAAVDELTRQGHKLSDEDIARLSPFVRAHVNTQGRYSFARPQLGGELRTLHDPDEDAIV